MAEFSLKIKLNDTNIELQGDEGMVSSIFTKITTEGLGILNGNGQLKEEEEEKLYQIEENKEQIEQKIEHQTYPSLHEIVLKNSPNTEPEWILVYTFYASEFGKTSVTKKRLRELYHETKRYTKVRGVNFNTNIKSLLNSNDLNAITQEEFSITEKGIEKAMDILNRENTIKGKKSLHNKRSGLNYKIIDLPMNKDQREAFKEFYNRYRPILRIDQILLVGYWINKYIGLSIFHYNTIFTLLSIAQENTNFDIPSAIKNMAFRNNYLVGTKTKGYYRLTSIGEDKVISQIMKKEK